MFFSNLKAACYLKQNAELYTFSFIFSVLLTSRLYDSTINKITKQENYASLNWCQISSSLTYLHQQYYFGVRWSIGVFYLRGVKNNHQLFVRFYCLQFLISISDFLILTQRLLASILLFLCLELPKHLLYCFLFMCQFDLVVSSGW